MDNYSQRLERQVERARSSPGSCVISRLPGQDNRASLKSSNAFADIGVWSEEVEIRPTTRRRVLR
jgi:hypothetical protein